MHILLCIYVRIYKFINIFIVYKRIWTSFRVIYGRWCTILHSWLAHITYKIHYIFHGICDMWPMVLAYIHLFHYYYYMYIYFICGRACHFNEWPGRARPPKCQNGGDFELCEEWITSHSTRETYVRAAGIYAIKFQPFLYASSAKTDAIRIIYICVCVCTMPIILEFNGLLRKWQLCWTHRYTNILMEFPSTYMYIYPYT